MYDKYLLVNPITTGTVLPKHKGLLIAGATAGGTKFTASFVKAGGLTFSSTFDISQTPYILPIQVYSIPSIPSGLTAFYLN
jgi:hypothetical protein